MPDQSGTDLFVGIGAKTPSLSNALAPKDEARRIARGTMNRLLIALAGWRPDILRWIAAILIFALFAWV